MGASAARANNTSMAACPARREASTSAAGIDRSSDSLIVSLLSSGSPSSPATSGARVDLPLPGGPDTAT